jgi:hypothetical protein
MNTEAELLRRIRCCIGIIILGLIVGGATAIPLRAELNWLTHLLDPGRTDSLSLWLNKVRAALDDTDAKYPFLAYGTDWLAFGHFVIALVFFWAWKDPVRYSGLFNFGILACILIIPYAFTLGQSRQIPWGWRLIDCSFGLFGLVPLLLARKWVQQLEARRHESSTRSRGEARETITPQR